MDPARVEALATQLESKYPAQASQVRAPLTLVDEVSASFLDHYTVVSVQVRSMRHPLLFYAATAADRPAHLLSSDAADLQELLADDGAGLDSEADAVAFVRLLVTLDRKSSRLTRIVESVDDIPLRERLEGSTAKQAEIALSELRASIAATTAEASEGGWIVSIWIARDAGVAAERYEVGRDGVLLGHREISRVELPLIVVG